MPSGIVSDVPGILGLALLAARWFAPAESAHLGETLWIVQLWLLAACVWSLFILLRRGPPPGLDRADAAVWMLVAGHVLSACIVLSSVGQKRYALNMLWEWAGVGVSITLLRQWLRGAAGLQQVVRTMAIGSVVLGGLGLWQYSVEFPTYRGQLQELIQLEARLGTTAPPLSSGEQSRLRELRLQLGSLATEQDPVARVKLRQRLLDSTEPLGRFALANTLGGVLAAGLVLLLGGISTASQRATAGWRRALSLLAAGLVAYCLVLTKSRTAWAGLLVGVIGWGLMSYGRRISLRRALPGIAVACVTVAVLIIIAVWSGGLDRLVLTEAPKSLGYRFEYWNASTRVIADHLLFGVGPGNFRQHYLRHKLAGSSEEILDPHNQFLDAWACGGVVALSGLAWVWLLFLRRCRAADDDAPADGPTSGPLASRVPAAAWRLSAVGIMALLSVYLVQFVFETVQDLQAIALLAGWIVAASVLYDIEVPRPAMLAAGLTLGVHLLGAGGISMPAISVPLLLLMLGTASSSGLPPVARERSITDRWRSRLPHGALLLILLLAAGGCLITGAWPSYYARLLLAAGESAVFSARDRAAARRDFEAATQTDDLDPDPWYDLASLDYSVVRGNTAADDESFNRAVQNLREAIRRDPLAPKLHWTAGQWQLTRFRSTRDSTALDLALQSMQRARDGYPHHAGIRGTRAEVLAAAARPDAAEEARVALRLDDINHERGHTDVWLDLETRARLQVIADQAHSTPDSDAETLP